MKTLFCVGDSIRFGYEPTVVKELSGLVNVIEMGETQGGDTRNVLAHLDEWVLSKSYDIIHLNAGLHDMIRSVGPGPTTQVPYSEYRENLKLIFSTLRAKTSATVIFGLTTPVNLSRQLAFKYPCNRIDEDVVKYNAAARDIAGDFGVHINDLYSFVIANDMDRMHDDDGCHFKPEASVLLGKKVADEIRAHAL